MIPIKMNLWKIFFSSWFDSILPFNSTFFMPFCSIGDYTIGEFSACLFYHRILNVLFIVIYFNGIFPRCWIASPIYYLCAITILTFIGLKNISLFFCRSKPTKRIQVIWCAWNIDENASNLLFYAFGYCRL